MSMNRPARGMTMIEAIVASSIFAMVIALSFGITHWSTSSFQQQIREGTLADKGEKAIKFMQEELADATLLSGTGMPDDVTTGGYTFRQAQLRFRVPLRYKNNDNNAKGHTVFIKPVTVQTDPVTGAIITSPTFVDDFDFRLHYGWRDNQRFVANAHDNNKLVPLQGPGLQMGSSLGVPAGVQIATASFVSDESPPGTYLAGTTMGGYIRFRFVLNTQMSMGKYGRNGIISEADERVDLDGDGAFTSTFGLGYMERSYFIGPVGNETQVEDSRQSIGDTCIIQPCFSTSATTASEAASLKSNRIFWQDLAGGQVVNPGRLQLYLWVFDMTSSGEPHLMRCTTTLFMRNNATYVRAVSATGTDD